MLTVLTLSWSQVRCNTEAWKAFSAQIPSLLLKSNSDLHYLETKSPLEVMCGLKPKL